MVLISLTFYSFRSASFLALFSASRRFSSFKYITFLSVSEISRPYLWNLILRLSLSSHTVSNCDWRFWNCSKRSSYLESWSMNLPSISLSLYPILGSSDDLKLRPPCEAWSLLWFTSFWPWWDPPPRLKFLIDYISFRALLSMVLWPWWPPFV